MSNHKLAVLAVVIVMCGVASSFAYLHPGLGRFVQRDPVGYVDGCDLYEYESGNPQAGVDPRGLWGPGRERENQRIEREIDRLERFISEHSFSSDPEIQADVERARREIEVLRGLMGRTPLGHSDFPGGDEFDYNLEDDDENTNPVTGDRARHFRQLQQSVADIEGAIARCDADAFQRAMHRMQDYYAHVLPGFKYDLPWHPGHLFSYVGIYPDPDDPTNYNPPFHEKRWQQASLKSGMYYDKFKATCCKTSEGAWQRK